MKFDPLITDINDSDAVVQGCSVALRLRIPGDLRNQLYIFFFFLEGH